MNCLYFYRKSFFTDENAIAKLIVDVAYRIHRELGPGLFESVYESVFDYELTNEYGLFVQRQPTLR
jgi:GxxExxY protein